MAFTLPTAASTGDVLTATAFNQAVRSNAMFGMATFTNEAARDAALTSPEEGMMAYLTAPTVPAATGVTTAIPTGVITIYNGTNWVCVTPVGANSATDATTASTTFASTLTSDTTAVSVTLVTGTTALVSFGWYGSVNGAYTVVESFAVSGATTLAASDANGIYMNGNGINLTSHRHQIFTGLTAGTNTFTLNYRTTAGTATFLERWLVVQGVA